MSQAPLILAIDDDDEILVWVLFKLTKAGFKVKIAKNVLDGIREARKEKPALILMDIQMPGMEGHVATSLIKDIEELERIPVLLMTALPEEQARAKFAESGAADLLLKPLQEEKMVEAVRRWIAK